jgi:hypothetical protein
MPPMLECRCTRGWCTTGLPVGCAATDAQHTLQERTGVGQRPAAESGMPRSICYLLPWPPGWCCSRQPCSCGGEATVVWTRRTIVGINCENRKSGRMRGSRCDVLRVEGSFGPHRPCPPQTSSPAHQVPHGDAPCRAACSRGTGSAAPKEIERENEEKLENTRD